MAACSKTLPVRRGYASVTTLVSASTKKNSPHITDSSTPRFFLRVIDAVLEDAFPAGRVDGQILGLDERVEHRRAPCCGRRRPARATSVCRARSSSPLAAIAAGRASPSAGPRAAAASDRRRNPSRAPCRPAGARASSRRCARRLPGTPSIAGQRVDLAVAVQRPGQAAGPAAVGAQPWCVLCRRNLPVCEVEDALRGPSSRRAGRCVSRVVRQWATAIAPQFLVAGLVGRVEDDRHVHHDVDEQRIAADERAAGTGPSR